MKNRKTYLKIVAIVAIPTLLLLILRVATKGKAANWIVDLLQNMFPLSFEEAQTFYLRFIRSNLDYIIIALFALGVIILSCIFIFYSRKQRARDAKIAEQRKNELITYLAHDIKTPLTSVVGYLSLLDESPDMPEEMQAKYIHIALEKANRLEKLVDEFFEITRYNFQAESLSKEIIDLYYMLVQMSDEFYPLLSAKGKEIVLLDSEQFTIYGDPDKLARVFNNILKNAIAYGADHSTITISAAMLDHSASITFTNEGGVSQDKLAAVFDKFYRLDSARSSDTGGAGLGLAIAKEIVLSHGGKIYADSDGKQTSFIVELPAAPRAALRKH